MMVRRIVTLILFLSIATWVSAQDTLPNFTLVESGDKVIISWVNPFEQVIQLNVQRSYDSLKNFTTIYSATSPQLPQNGFSDRKIASNKVYYRIFFVLDGGNYFFSPVRRVGSVATSTSARDVNNINIFNSTPGDNKFVTIKIKDVVYRTIPAYNFKSFRDSILLRTQDTLIAVTEELVLLSPYIFKEAWRPSTFIYSNRAGYINISLPLVNERKYSIKFFEESGTMLFDIPHVRESPLILDKSNFIHAGWFLFELYENDKLKEKNKFYLPKDF
ncbi:MAG: hypothetical protein JWQ96_2350 [Segetibacter sp.]|nr:hypothetical protein [Segetibacter sp.]